MRALITGFSGQDGQFLSRLLLDKGYEVDGLVRKTIGRTKKTLYRNDNEAVNLVYGNIISQEDMERIFEKKYDEVYHLASQSDVGYSFIHPYETYRTNFIGTFNVFKQAFKKNPDVKIYFAGTSEMYGNPPTKPQNEVYPFNPVSPYAISKLGGFHMGKMYRKQGYFVANGILYNHESRLRGKNFVTQKIVHGIVDYLDRGKPFEIGNIYAKKDWGYAEDYVYGMYLMLQQDMPDDFVLATGEQHTVKDIFETILKYLHIHYEINNEGIFNEDNGEPIAIISPKYFRPLEAQNYCGDYSKAKTILKWKPEVKFKELIIHKMLLPVLTSSNIHEYL